MTLTKHRGHGAKPLSRENKEILSSFVRRGGTLSPSPRLSLSLPTSITPPTPVSLSLTFIYFYSPLFALHPRFRRSPLPSLVVSILRPNPTTPNSNVTKKALVEWSGLGI